MLKLGWGCVFFFENCYFRVIILVVVVLVRGEEMLF